MNPMSDKEIEDFLRQANWFMRGLIDQNQKEFKLDGFARFDWDQWRGELVFSSGGVPKVVARIQVVGSLSMKANTWFWAWANSEILDPVRQSARRTREFGIERGMLRLMQPRWAAKDKDAWDMTAVTTKLTDAKGAFRCPGQDGFTYMVFTDLRAVSDRKRVFGARACSHVLEEDRPILLVSKELDGEVLAVCGGEDDSAATTRDLPLDRLLALDPTLTELASMSDGWAALRESPDDPWNRSKAE
jgi:uncharacterized protein DUF6882